MQTDDRNQRVNALVENYLSSGLPLQDYLDGVDQALRDEVREQCEEALFVRRYFDGLPPPPRQTERPQRIGGCELLDQIGSGAMGQVFCARQVEPERLVAVKLVRGELSARDDYLARFRREAQILAELDHPNIVRVLWSGEEQGFCYFVMELVRGRDLTAAIEALSGAFATQPERAADKVARITAELLETLAYAHGRGVVHRDLKPSNVMLDDDDHPHLVDFGLAKPFEHEAPNWHVRTVPGLLLGTPAYWSPEVAARLPFVRESPDIWAAGVILFQLLTGHLPYTGATTDKLLANLTLPECQDPRQLVPAIPSALAAICRQALAPDPGERYGSAQEFAADLRRFLARQPTQAEAHRPIERTLRHVWRQRHRYGLGVLAGAVAATIWLFAENATTIAATRDAAADLIAAIGADEPPLSSLPMQAARARELLASGRLAADQTEALAHALDRIETRAREQRRRGHEMITRGAGSPPGTPRAEIAAPNTSLQLRGLQIADVAALVLGDTEDELGLLGGAFPHLQIDDPVGRGPTSFRVDALEPIGGQPLLNVATGTTPFDIALPPGDYRVVVGDGAQFAECSRTLGPPSTTVVVPRLLASTVAQQDMIAIPAGTAVVGQNEAGAYIYAQQTIAYAAFYIDRTEVPCGAYHAFCAATGAALPGKWNGSYDPAWHDLPVVGVSAAEATAYAEWCGKRLPTWTEWQVAARGANGALYPWGNDPAPFATMPSIGGDPNLHWYEGVRPVGTVPLDTSWCGAQDMLGNIDEWTSTAYVAQWNGMPFPVYPWRLRAGSHWDAARDRYSALDTVSPGPPEWFGSGFRCAKSSNP